MRMIKRAYNKIRKAAKKRYVAKSGGRKSTGGIRVGKLAKDVMYLKSVLNPEKKRTEESVIATDPFGAIPLGQINGNNDGALVRDCTPYLTVGPSYNQRTGASVKLHSTVWNFQITQQENCVNTINCIFEVWQLDEQVYSNLETFRRAKYQFNPFVLVSGVPAIRDSNSQMNPDNFSIGRCIARRRIRVLGDNISTQKNVVNFKMPILYNKGKGHHLRWDKDTTTLTTGQLCLIIRCDRGNMSSGAATSVTGVPDTGALTGLTVQYSKQDYYYDN